VAARFFATPEALRQWLDRHHARATELWIGFYRKDSGRGGLTYPEAVEAALCFGWIDGIRKKLDDASYANRFTPRKPGSIWSTVNIGHVERLKAAGRMHQSGLDAYARRDPAKSGIYSFEQRPQRFPPPHEERFRATPKAWAHFSAQPPGYQRLGIWYVMSAKRDETRMRRLQQLIDAHAQGVRMGVLFGQTGPGSAEAAARQGRSKSQAPAAKRPAPGPKPR
jgi:uncharacterized protein YdeI (YjbR/CyaY-like superfamily)